MNIMYNFSFTRDSIDPKVGSITTGFNIKHPHHPFNIAYTFPS